MGTPVVALCGKVWVPSRDPEKYPVCPECKDAWENLKKDDEIAAPPSALLDPRTPSRET